MSRCFPFPPPGYEKKARTDDVELLTKEKRKEKKHKKEKRDKESREGKEKKDKERSKDKHKEKKDRKEKHRSKKDKNKDEDKNRTSDEKKIEKQPESHGQNLGESSQRSEEIKNSKLVEELGRRVRNGGTGNQMVANFIVPDHGRGQRLDRVGEKDIVRQGKGTEFVNNSKKEEDRKAGGQRNGNGTGGMGNTGIQNFSERVSERVSSMEKGTEKRMEVGEKIKDQEGDDTQGRKHKDRDAEKKNKGKNEDKEKKNKGKNEDREKKNKEKNEEKEKKNKEKNEDTEKKNKGKNEDSGKEKKNKGKSEDSGKEKKKEKVKEKRNHRNKDMDSLRESENDLVDTVNIKPSNVPMNHEKSAFTEGNLRKRKEFETNGFINGNEILPNKLPRPISSSHLLTENGRKLEPCQASVQCASVRLGITNNENEHKVNGVIQAQASSFRSTRPLLPTTQDNENVETSTKPPHPDSKYLSQILSIPKVGDWFDIDDQEWLFSTENIKSKNAKVGPSGADENQQVWAKALRIESADICALPYVIPY